MRTDHLLARSLSVIPAGGQTDTKTIAKRIVGAQPSFFVRGKGAYAQDPDGVWWLDCQMGLGAYILGYSDSRVISRVKKQLKLGSIFSLSSPLEVEVAERLLEILPEFQMVRFGKNGSDATSAAIRIARSITGRDHALGCGYHGFQDWSMTLRPGIEGIPGCVRDLTKGQEIFDLRAVHDLLDAFPNQFAAVIVDLGGSNLEDFSMLSEIRAKCTETGTVLIFDEIVSGFRAGLRGVFGMGAPVPDLLCLGKALANGFPLSALLGPERLMSLAPSAGMSATFAGDCIGLAAAQATLEQLSSVGFYAALNARGSRLLAAIAALISKYELGDQLRVSGYPALVKLLPRRALQEAGTLLRLLMKLLAKRGVFWQGSFVLCRDFGERELELIIAALDEVLAMVAEITRTSGLEAVSRELRNSEKQYLANLARFR